jgi:flagellar protein FlaG
VKRILGVVSMRVGPVGSDLGVMPKSELHVERSSSENSSNVEDLNDVLNTMQKKVKKFQEVFKSEAEFKVDRSTGMVIVKIKNKDTGEVVRQIPPEVVVKLAKTIEEFLGLLLDERA